MTFSTTSPIIPDISFYQDDPTTPQQVDFHKMKTAGASGIIVRAGQNTWVDPDFAYNWQKVKEAGLPRGAYWFYDSRSSPESQAARFLNTVGADLPELGYWADLEETYGGTYRGWQNWKIHLSTLRKERGIVGIYTSPYYWKTYRPTNTAEWPFFASFPLWIANYGVETPEIPAPWTLKQTIFWQFTTLGDGLRYGVESKGIDLNRFNGTPEDFKKLFSLQEGVETMKFGKVQIPALNIRSSLPGGEYADIGDFVSGDLLESDAQYTLPSGDVWWKITKATRNGQTINTTRGVVGTVVCYAAQKVVTNLLYIVEVPPPSSNPRVAVQFTAPDGKIYKADVELQPE